MYADVERDMHMLVCVEIGLMETPSDVGGRTDGIRVFPGEAFLPLQSLPIHVCLGAADGGFLSHCAWAGNPVSLLVVSCIKMYKATKREWNYKGRFRCLS